MSADNVLATYILYTGYVDMIWIIFTPLGEKCPKDTCK